MEYLLLFLSRPHKMEPGDNSAMTATMDAATLEALTVSYYKKVPLVIARLVVQLAQNAHYLSF